MWRYGSSKQNLIANLHESRTAARAVLVEVVAPSFDITVTSPVDKKPRALVTIKFWVNLPSSFYGVQSPIVAARCVGQACVHNPELGEAKITRFDKWLPHIQHHFGAFERWGMGDCCWCICMLMHIMCLRACTLRLHICDRTSSRDTSPTSTHRNHPIRASPELLHKQLGGFLRPFVVIWRCFRVWTLWRLQLNIISVSVEYGGLIFYGNARYDVAIR